MFANKIAETILDEANNLSYASNKLYQTLQSPTMARNIALKKSITDQILANICKNTSSEDGQAIKRIFIAIKHLQSQYSIEASQVEKFKTALQAEIANMKQEPKHITEALFLKLCDAFFRIPKLTEKPLYELFKEAFIDKTPSSPYEENQFTLKLIIMFTDLYDYVSSKQNLINSQLGKKKLGRKNLLERAMKKDLRSS